MKWVAGPHIREGEILKFVVAGRDIKDFAELFNNQPIGRPPPVRIVQHHRYIVTSDGIMFTPSDPTIRLNNPLAKRIPYSD